MIVLIGLNLVSLHLASYIFSTLPQLEVIILSTNSIDQLLANELIVTQTNGSVFNVTDYLSQIYQHAQSAVFFKHLIFHDKPQLLNYLLNYFPPAGKQLKIINTWQDLASDEIIIMNSSNNSSDSNNNSIYDTSINTIRCQFLIIKSLNVPQQIESHKSDLNQLTTLIPINSSNFLICGPLQLNDTYQLPRNSDSINLMTRSRNLFPQYFQNYQLLHEKVIFKHYYQNNSINYSDYHNNNSHDIINHPNHPLNPFNKFSIGNISFSYINHFKILNLYGFGFNDYNLLPDIIYYFNLLCSNKNANQPKL